MSTAHRTTHWTGVVAAALLFAGAGVLTRQPAALAAGAVAAAYAGYAAVVGPGTLPPAARRGDAVAVERSLSDDTPSPGAPVTVTVTLENETDQVLPDVRVVDGVPRSLGVAEGTPRHATALRPGERATFEYAVAARRGHHTWRPAQVVVADPSGAVEHETQVAADATVDVRGPVEDATAMPVREQATPVAGRVTTGSGGSGVAFHSTREYRHGDPLSRVDWHRLAKTGSLGTLAFQEERAATVQLLVDVREAAYLAPAPETPHAVDLSVRAARRALSSLLDAGDRVGVGSFGRPVDARWLDPGTGRDHRRRADDVLAEGDVFSTRPPESPVYARFRPDRRRALRRRRVTELHRRLPDVAQVVLFSPCCDDYPMRAATRFEALGHRVTVVSPDPTRDDTPSRTLARLERSERLRRLRHAGVRVVDWAPDEDLAAALGRAAARWSQ